MNERWMNGNLGGGFEHFLFSPRIPGEDSHFDQYFADGLKPPTSNYRMILTLTFFEPLLRYDHLNEWFTTDLYMNL